jgi:microcystin-dependent protein
MVLGGGNAIDRPAKSLTLAPDHLAFFPYVTFAASMFRAIPISARLLLRLAVTFSNSACRKSIEFWESSMDSPFVSAIVPWPLDWAPVGFAACNGQQLSVNQYMALYSLIGVTYGGTPSTSFNLPDLRGRTIMGFGTQTNPPGATYTLGQHGGAEQSSLATNNLPPLPPHTHGASFTPTGGGPLSVSVDITAAAVSSNSVNTPANEATYYLSGSTTNIGPTQLKGPLTTTAPSAGSTASLGGVSGSGGGITGGVVSVQSSSAYSGSPAPFENRPPYLVLNFIIAVNGLYPPRP